MLKRDRRDKMTGLLDPWRPAEDYYRKPEFHPEDDVPWLATPLPLDTVFIRLDIASMRRFNDAHGMKAGDAVIVATAAALAKAAAPWPVFYGGADEFLVAARLRGAREARAFAEMLRSAVVAGSGPKMWAGAAMADPGDDAGLLYRTAGDALMSAQRDGARGVNLVEPDREERL